MPAGQRGPQAGRSGETRRMGRRAAGATKGQWERRQWEAPSARGAPPRGRAPVRPAAIVAPPVTAVAVGAMRSTLPGRPVLIRHPKSCETFRVAESAGEQPAVDTGPIEDRRVIAESKHLKRHGEGGAREEQCCAWARASEPKICRGPRGAAGEAEGIVLLAKHKWRCR